MNREFLLVCSIVFGALLTALVISEYQIYDLTVEIDIRGNTAIATARDGKRTVEMQREIPVDFGVSIDENQRVWGTAGIGNRMVAVSCDNDSMFYKIVQGQNDTTLAKINMNDLIKMARK